MNPLAWLSPGRWLLYGAFAASLLLGYFTWRSHERDIGAASVQARWDKDKAAQAIAAQKADAKNRQIEQALEQKVKDAQNEAHKRAEILQANADAAAHSADSLRNQLATVRGQLPALADAAVRSYASTASDVLGECTSRYQEVAAEADRLSGDIQTLKQAWPK